MCVFREQKIVAVSEIRLIKDEAKMEMARELMTSSLWEEDGAAIKTTLRSSLCRALTLVDKVGRQPSGFQ